MNVVCRCRVGEAGTLRVLSGFDMYANLPFDHADYIHRRESGHALGHFLRLRQQIHLLLTKENPRLVGLSDPCGYALGFRLPIF